MREFGAGRVDTLPRHIARLDLVVGHDFERKTRRSRRGGVLMSTEYRMRAIDDHRGPKLGALLPPVKSGAAA